MSNNIESILAMMEEMLDTAFTLPMSRGKVLVDADKFHEMTEDIRLALPEEITRAQEVVANRKTILEEAKKEAEMTIRVAEERAKKLVDQNEIVKQAEQKASELISNSQLQAKELKRATGDYVENMLHSTEEQLSKMVTELRSKRQALKNGK